MKHKFWNWLDDADSEERTLVLNGTITDEDWFEDSVTPGKFRDELAKCDGDINVWINSEKYFRLNPGEREAMASVKARQ